MITTNNTTSVATGVLTETMRSRGEINSWASGLPDNATLDTVEAATFLTGHGYRVSPTTLETWRVRRSDGPRFLKFGKRRVAYRAGDLREFLSSAQCGEAA